MKHYRYPKMKEYVLKAFSAVLTFILAAACYGILRTQWLDDYSAKGVSLVLGYVVWDVSSKAFGIRAPASAPNDSESFGEGSK